MELFLVYLLKSAGLIALFFLSYRLLLAKETFFGSNRIFLLAGVPIACLLPLLYFTKTVYVPLVENIPALGTTIEYSSPETVTPAFDWRHFIGILYGLGMLFFFGRLVLQLYSLWKVVQGGNRVRSAGFIFVETTTHDGPFSFFKYIVYNPARYDENALKSILAHEKVHAVQWHSIDLLLMHLLCIFQWFNPFAWGYKKSVGQNLEYLADMKATSALPCKKEYQYLLLRQSLNAPHELTIINPFFNSLIKKRIVMINRTKSNQINAFKYVCILPFLGLFLITFNTKIAAQTVTEKSEYQSKNDEEKDKVYHQLSFVVKKNTTDEQLKVYESRAMEDRIILKFNNVERNTLGEITRITSSFKDFMGNSGNWSANADRPIRSFRFYYELNTKQDLGTIGYGSPETHGSGATTTGEKDHLTPSEKTHINGAVKQLIAQQPIEVEGRGDHLLSSFLTPSLDQQPQLALTGYVQEAQEKKPAYIVDGELQDRSFVFEKLDKSTIESIHVFKGQKAKDKFGKNYENGVVQIITKNMQKNGWKVSVPPRLQTDPEKNIDVTDFFTEDVSNPIVIIDGKNKGKNYQRIKIKEVNIESASLFAPSDTLSKKYGSQAKDGVLEIITKKRHE